MKRILHILAQKPGNTGSGVFLNTLINEAVKKDYEQAVIAGISSQDSSYDFREDINFFPVIFETEHLPFPVVGMSNEMPYESTKYSELTDEMMRQWNSEFNDAILQAVQEFKPDIILSHHLWLLTSIVVELVPKIPVYAFCHSTGLRQMDMVPGFRDFIVNRIKNVKKVFSLTEFQKQKIISKYHLSKDKITVTGAGFNSEMFYRAQNQQHDDVRIVYCGKLSFAKGVLSLINAFESGVFDAALTLVGNGRGQEKEDILKRASKSKKKITFKGSVSQEVLGEIFRESDIFVLSSFYEGLPLVVIEALACGLRVVVTDIPGLKDWVGKDINNSGMIEYVKLPKLINTDIPKPEEVPIFESRLKSAIETQIISLKTSGQKDIQKYLRDKTWTEVFEKIERELS
jgi:glycosyltransferase involved in cell wall biosynthesis